MMTRRSSSKTNKQTNTWDFLKEKKMCSVCESSQSPQKKRRLHTRFLLFVFLDFSSKPCYVPKRLLELEEGRQQPTKLSQIKSLWRWMRHHSELIHKTKKKHHRYEERKKRSVDGSIFRVVPPVCGGIKKDACEVTDEQSIDFSLEMDCSEWILFSFSFWGRGENKQTKQKRLGALYRSKTWMIGWGWLRLVQTFKRTRRWLFDDRPADDLYRFTALLTLRTTFVLQWPPLLWRVEQLLFLVFVSGWFFGVHHPPSPSLVNS